MNTDEIATAEKGIAEAIKRENQLQKEGLMMIASENISTSAVKKAQGSLLTNRNALGYPDSRLYPGSENIDEIEQIAIHHAKELWGAEHVNVQPHSGSLANLAVYMAVLDPGDKILALHPQNGGHITHGSSLHISGELYETDYYRLDPETEKLDYDAVAEKAREYDPDLIISGYSTYPRKINWERFQEISNNVGAYHLADIAHTSGIIAAGKYPSPVGIAEFCTSSTYKTIRSGRGGIIMCDNEFADAVDEALFPGLQGGAIMPTIAGKAVGFAQALSDEYEDYIDQVIANAKTLASEFSKRGIGVVTGGTDTHIVLIDLSTICPGLTGEEAEEALETVGVIANKASVPNESNYPAEVSGIRFGTANLTAQGFDEDQMRSVADLISDVLENANDQATLKELSIIDE